LSRIRSLKPDWLEDERMSSCSIEARVLSIALILLADDYGRGRAGRMLLLGRVFPGMAPETLTKACDDLAPWYVRFYEADGQTYFQITNWEKHQRVDRPGPDRFPRPNPESSTEYAWLEDRANNRESSRAAPEDSRSFPTSRDPLPNSGSGSPFLADPESDQPEKSGSARARRKPRAKSEHVPFAMHDAWAPESELVASLAEQYSVTVERILATLPEFRYFWKRRADRKKHAGWERAFSSNVERLAKGGSLYAQPRAMPMLGGHAAVFERAGAIVGTKEPS